MKKFNLARVLIPALVLASFFGCSNGLDGDALSGVPLTAQDGGALSGVLPAARSAGAAPEAAAYPASLVNTRWLYNPVPAATEPRAAVVSFVDASHVVVIGSDISYTQYDYSYAPGTGSGSILLSGTVKSTFQIDSDGTLITITAGVYVFSFTADLLPAITQPGLAGKVVNGPTPRYPFNTIDFKTGAIGSLVQTTFGDGTFPAYQLVYYDGLGAGIIEKMGLFYLGPDSSGNSVIFPDFYQYHMDEDVTYTLSAEVLGSLTGTTWTASDNSTVTFKVNPAHNTNYAVYSGSTLGYPYVYNGKSAGGVGLGSPGVSTEGGSFEVDIDSSGKLSLKFYNFRNTGVTKIFNR
jgi:hypothetical protein